jgi:uncharacterized lipoprotein YajG
MHPVAHPGTGIGRQLTTQDTSGSLGWGSILHRRRICAHRETLRHRRRICSMRKTSLAALAAALILSGCWTTHLTLTYQAPPTVTAAAVGTPTLMVGTFLDVRGYKRNWIGRIRGTFGNSLEKLVVDESVATLVQTQFRDGLLARQFPVVDADGVFEISGVIRKLSSIQYVHVETDVEIEVQLRRLSTRNAVFTHTYSAHALQASRAYTVQAVESARPVDAIRTLTQKTLREVVNQALDDPAFREALRSQAPIH